MVSRAGYLKYGGNDYVRIWREQSAPAPIRAVIAKWKREAARREKQDYDWPLKHVGIVFEYDGIWYNMTPEALHVTNDAYFEVLSDEICDDLAAAGAEDVFCTAMLD